MPTLVTCGEYDEGPPWAARITAELLPDSRLQVFGGLSHMSHIEAPDVVTGVTARFLARAR
jgi:pimeloyl-ACP methyl ester carboxylesterase